MKGMGHASRPGRPRLGSIAELVVGNGRIAYLQLVSKHPEFGELVRVLDPSDSRTTSSLEALAREKELFFVYLPFTASIKKGLLAHLGAAEHLGDSPLPPLMRRPAQRSAAGAVESWWVDSPSGEVLVKSLTDRQREYSLAVIWNVEFLRERLLRGWTPPAEV
jgi:hypothetical protein